ncbi:MULTISPECIES: exodeoxyribonuclease III [unclassified Erysipelothrix]|uniref:exodeoxyribonuclease III n=1 Tax=unclassified Erysipelothrix TaxID=2624170 RepID=UPI00190D7540|nr:MULTISPECIES: exodeoxyribonuclease III [unclassified Erysipelothrix]MBK2402169.1 exodeoxyribonuclease III [Erysipelothrix sp. strain 2 (EsS2-6-Brazil)]MBK2404664.1 exodeoxyribonuclease III [Erysipelothrix sp. strain 2 (EsS2-7-Brazil)]
MKLISWNVNGLRAVMKKDFEGIFEAMDTDVLCLQETKMQAGQLDYDPEGYYAYYNYAEKKGYSGTAVYTRIKPINVTYGIQEDEHNAEGRVITCEYDNFFLVCVYTPNSQPELKRIDYRMQWENDFREYLKMLDESKPVVLCGDLNVAHKEIDLKNPSANRKNPGFSDQEREQFTNLLDAGFIDSFRELHPNEVDRYSWWSYRFNARSRNAGWRIDYFVVSERLRNAIEDADILDQVLGSDHCPVMLKLNF